LVNLRIGYCSLCSGRVGRITEVGLVCGFYIVGCVLVECEKDRGCFSLWMGCCWLCSGRVGRVSEVGLFCGLVIASCVVVDWEGRQWLV
jgi:hypothetical protein